MKLLFIFLAALLPSVACAQEVARVFGVPVSAAELGWKPGEPAARGARQLRERVLKDAVPRFIAANDLKATPDEIAAYGRWEAEFRRREKRDAAFKPDPASASRVHGKWIEGYKLKKALFEKYGGRVGITKWGPDPVGATEALLREHARNGELQILDEALANAFWDALAEEPRMPATRPEHMDFTYYWTKPVDEARR